MKLRKTTYLFLLLIMTISMVGCGKDEEEADDSYVINYEGSPNVTASSDTKWIDSEIYGAIDDSLEISEKDDFYTANNKEWILSQSKPTNEHDDVTVLMEGDSIVKERLINIVSGKQDADAFDGSQVDIADEEIAHDQELVVRFVNAAADWDSRNAAGASPLKKYIDDIDSLTTIDELTAYLSDLEDRNISNECLLDFESYAGIIDAENYRCVVTPKSSYVLNEAKAYTDLGFTNKQEKHLTDEVVKKVLEEIGYDESYAMSVLTDCYRLEGMLIDHTNEKLASNSESFEKGCTLDELIKLAGDYPLETMYRAYGYSVNEDIRMPDRGYLKYLNNIYNDSHLDMLKSYFIVHTINTNILFLDRDYYDMVIDSLEKYDKKSEDSEGKGDVKEAEIKDDWDLILNKYALPLISGPLNVVYISRYCSQEEKIEIVNLIDEIIEHYHVMLETEDWMTDKAKAAAVEKLDYMTVRALYPDKMDSFMDLSFDEDDDLVAMAQKIRLFEAKRMARRANTPVDKEKWDLGEFPTTLVNAYYKPDENSINIMAGIVSGKNVFNIDAPYEVKLACLGTVIGHEISHAFDTNGCYFDKNGYNDSWWELDDMTSFQLRANKLNNYYNGISPYPGATNLTGTVLSGEAIADMGGMKAALMIAKDREDFDYDLFFRSYASLWRTFRSLGSEMGYAEMDDHPLPYLRTNITLMQFDEFIDTYGICPGDGMYMAAEDRVLVW